MNGLWGGGLPLGFFWLAPPGIELEADQVRANVDWVFSTCHTWRITSILWVGTGWRKGDPVFYYTCLEQTSYNMSVGVGVGGRRMLLAWPFYGKIVAPDLAMGGQGAPSFWLFLFGVDAWQSASLAQNWGELLRERSWLKCHRLLLFSLRASKVSWVILSLFIVCSYNNLQKLLMGFLKKIFIKLLFFWRGALKKFCLLPLFLHQYFLSH